MSKAYQELLRGFTIEAHDAPTALPADLRAITRWIDALPRTDVLRTAELLGGALFQALTVTHIGGSRFTGLQALRPIVLDCIEGLNHQYLGSPLPLANDRLLKAEHARYLHHVLAESYRRAVVELCHPEGKIPLLRRAKIAACIVHCLWHGQQVLMLSWKLYRRPPPGIWSALRACYRYALSVKLHMHMVDDAIVHTAKRPHDVFVETALLALINPLAFAPAELEQIKSIAADVAARCTVCTHSASEHSAHLPRDAEEAADADVGFLEFSAFQAMLSATVSAHEGVSPEHAALRQRLLRALGQASARSAPRIYGEFQVETVLGLSAVHFFAAGRTDFETFIRNLPHINAAGKHAAAEWLDAGEAPSHRMLTATVLDHSLGGYRLVWQAGQSRARIGEVVGINSAAPGAATPDWMLGIIRWLRYESEGTITAGIELLTRRCTALALRLARNGPAGRLLRAVEIQALEEGLPRAFLLSERIEPRSPRLEIFTSHESFSAPPYGETIQAEAMALADNTDYTLLIAQG